MAVKELIVELSRNCNLSCVMCGFGGNDIKPEWFMGRELFEKVLVEFGGELEIIRLNGREESTIHPEFSDLLDLTRKRCPSTAIHLFTNLSWNQPELLARFIDYGVQLFISIDSPDAALMREIRRGCRPEQIEQNLQTLQPLGNRPFIVATLQEKNIDQVVPLAFYAAEHKCHLLFNTVRYHEGAPQLEKIILANRPQLVMDFDAATALLEKQGLRCHCPDQIHGIEIGSKTPGMTTGSGGDCPALNRELFITYSGKVQPCNMFHPYVLGDLNGDSLAALQTSRRWSWFSENHFDSDYCSNCAHMRAEV